LPVDVQCSGAASPELQTLRLQHADAVDVSNNVVAHDSDLALLAYLVRNCSRYRVPSRGTKGCADDLRGQRYQLIADHVALRSEGPLKKAAFLEVSNKPMRGRKRQEKRIGDLHHRDGFGLLGDMPNDGKRAVECSIRFGLLCR
jgi:hypothetical protein